MGFAAVAAPAAAQAPEPPPEYRWTVDAGIGFDYGFSGNINSGAIGTLSGQTVVLLKNTYGDVYGTGLHLRFGGGYAIRQNAELRVAFTFQSIDADLTRMGDLGVSNLYGQYDDYQSFGLDVGYRAYASINRTLRGYVEGTIGLAIIDELDVVLAAPQANLTGNATDFYDQTAAFAWGANAGIMVPVRPNTDVFFQIGLRWVSGLSDVDAFADTGLDDVNDHSARWAIPFGAGISFRF
jgi:hypothetical protein